MQLVSSFAMMATYNQRMNLQLLNCCDSLTKDQLNQSSQSFFCSVLDYWNHIMFGDLIMLNRLVGNGISQLDAKSLARFPKPITTQDTFATTLAEFRSLREPLDDVIVRFFDGLAEQECNQEISYLTTEGEAITQSVAVVCQHMLNHQTHHRGQLTCVLSQLGIDFGVTDLPVIVPEGMKS